MNNDLTKGKVVKTLILFALPLLVGNLVQQIYNISDTIIVGKFISDSALSSVGAAFPLFFLLISVLIGLSTGVNVIVSQIFGANDFKNVKKSAYTALISSGIIGLGISFLGFLLSEPLLNLLNTPEDIFRDSLKYIQIIFIFASFLFVYDIVAAIFNALGDSKTTLIFLIISSLLNIGLDLLFVIVFGKGVEGVAMATGISWIIAAILSIWVLLGRLKSLNSEKVGQIFDFGLLKNMSHIAIPAMFNQSLVAIGALAVQTVINGFGSHIIAGYTAASKVDTLAMMPIINLSIALTTFIAQNLGAGHINRAKTGFKSALIMSISFGFIMAIVILLYGDVIMQIFLDSEANAEIIEFGEKYLMIVAFGYCLMGFLFNSGAVLRASGTMKPFVISTFISIGAKVVSAYLLARILGSSVIRWSVIIGRGMGAIISMGAYLKGDWQKTKIINQIEK